VGEARCREARCREDGPLACDGATVIGAMGSLGAGRMGLWRATVIGAIGSLGLARLAQLAGHGLGERETEQRERTEQ
jgi:hypothetical protein